MLCIILSPSFCALCNFMSNYAVAVPIFLWDTRAVIAHNETLHKSMILHATVVEGQDHVHLLTSISYTAHTYQYACAEARSQVWRTVDPVHDIHVARAVYAHHEREPPRRLPRRPCPLKLSATLPSAGTSRASARE